MVLWWQAGRRSPVRPHSPLGPVVGCHFAHCRYSETQNPLIYTSPPATIRNSHNSSIGIATAKPPLKHGAMSFAVDTSFSQDSNAFTVRVLCPTGTLPSSILIDLERTSDRQVTVNVLGYAISHFAVYNAGSPAYGTHKYMDPRCSCAIQLHSR
jgi:hypothetical protein